MKLLSETIEKDKSGELALLPEDKDDLWAIYNLIAKGDLSTGSGSGGVNVRKLLLLTLRVESIEYTPSDEVMRIKGRTTEQNEDVPQGSYHTAELGLGQKVRLEKDEWDEIALDTIRSACSIEAKAEVGAVVLEEGVAHVCLLTENMTVLRNKVQKRTLKKRRGDSSQHDNALRKFIETTAESTLRNLDTDRLKAVILVSPGTTAKLLYEKIIEIATKSHNKQLLHSRGKFIVAHSSTGYLQGLEEALKTPENIILFDEFSKLLNEDQGKAWYGEEEVEKAAAVPGAIKVLMITDSLFKNDDVSRRKHYIELVDKVKESGAEVAQFSSLHDTGEQLNQLTGIAVILNYPMPDLDEDDE
ncbi:hypothetical protein HII13_004171 [Brettanomyces bruxellensis]|nr:hypothetical protein HII13_004171 [Brettanomyces bruxellensis]